MSNDIYEIRKANLRLLMEDAGGPNNLAKRLSLSNPSFLSHLAGPRPTRTITEKTARKIEVTMGLTENWLDSPVGSRITYASIKPKLQMVAEIPPKFDEEPPVANTQHSINVSESALDQNRLSVCIEKVLLRGESLSAKQLSKIVTVIYSSSQNVDELDNTIQSLVDLARSL